MHYQNTRSIILVVPPNALSLCALFALHKRLVIWNREVSDGSNGWSCELEVVPENPPAMEELRPWRPFSGQFVRIASSGSSSSNARGGMEREAAVHYCATTIVTSDISRILYFCNILGPISKHFYVF